MNMLQALKQLRDDIKVWVTNNLNALNVKIDERTISVDSELNSTSTNPVQNKVIKKAIDDIPTFSGDYNDLTNAPDISEDGSGSMTIADESGNIILRVDATGLQTTDVKIDNTSLKSKISSWDNKSDFSGDYNDLTNAPDISEDGSGNMVITDESGNIIFKADADGMHTTAVSINGEAAATEKYVDEAVASIPTPDVSGQINVHNMSEEAHSDIRQAIEDAKEELSESIVSESKEWIVADESGNVVAKVDASGLETTNVTAKSVVVNGVDIEDALNNKADAGHTHQETDPTVPAWAKEPNKPSYIASEVGALADTTVLADLTDDATHRTVTDAEKQAWNAKADKTSLDSHTDNKDNPHNVTATQIGLGNVDNTSDINKPISIPQQEALNTLKTELSENIVSESKEWTIVDESGNIIATVDVNGLATTTVTVDSVVLNGADVQVTYATKQYVDDAVAQKSQVQFITWEADD